MTLQDSKVWLITGCSSGFGNEIARQTIARGDRVIVTARDPSQLEHLIRGYEETTLKLALDVTRPDQIAIAVIAAEARFGRIDVLVNNAGYGYMATAEEGDEAEIRRQFDTNVFGLFAMTRAVLPIMRRQGRGHVINITSVAGMVGLPGSGYYAASKHAVEGWSDALAAEGKPIGIKVTCIEPGSFRTDWAARSMTQTPSRLSDYAETAGKRLAATRELSGKQPGDPVRAASAIIAIAGQENAPRHLVLGALGVDQVTGRLNAALGEIIEWGTIGRSTDYPVHRPE